MEAYRRFRYRLLGVLLIAGLLGGTARLWRLPWYRQVAARAWSARPQLDRARFIDAVDDFYTTSFPEGNLYIEFSQLRADRDHEFIFEQWWRATYLLHPRRVYVAPPGVRVHGHEELLERQRQGDDDWLDAAGVYAKLVFGETDGQPTRRIVRLGKDEP